MYWEYGFRWVIMICKMEKDKTIIQFLDKLKLITSFHLVEIIDYWDADLCAIGLKRGNKLVYINTFNPDDKYDFDLELLNPENVEKLNVIKEGRGVSEAEIITEIKEFLNI